MALAAWKRKGAVFPAVTVYYDLLKEARKAAGIEKWPHDALRHSFGSYHYGAHQSAALTQAQMGHTNPQIFFKHYRKPMKKTVAEKYWKIVPVAKNRGRKTVVGFAAAA